MGRADEARRAVGRFDGKPEVGDVGVEAVAFGVLGGFYCVGEGFSVHLVHGGGGAENLGCCGHAGNATCAENSMGVGEGGFEKIRAHITRLA